MSVRAFVFAVILAMLAAPAGAAAQDSSNKGRSETERKLENIKRELKQASTERRQIEGQRGDVTRQLRAADEKVGRSTRVLRDTEVRLTRDQQALAQLQQQRAQMQAALGSRREELARLLRAAYTQGEATPLQALLSQDTVAEA